MSTTVGLFLGGVVVTILVLLWRTIKSWLLGKKDDKLQSELQGAKDEANKKVGAADASYSEFERRLQQYRDSKK